ncbi:MAG: DUF4058 family protein, partial [Isosphaeraceae bacterium]
MGRAATATLSSPRSRTALGDAAAVAILGLLGTRPGLVSKLEFSLVGRASLGKSAYQTRSPAVECTRMKPLAVFPLSTGSSIMPSPFPGMDPYLEEPGLWPDVHT